MASKRKSKPPSSGDLKRYRRLYRQAAKKGLVKGDKDPNTLRPSKYMKSRLNKIEEFLKPEYSVMKTSPKSAAKYRGAESSLVPFVSGRTVVYRNLPGMRASVRQGNLAFTKRLRNGEYEIVPIPFRFTSWNDLKREFETNPIFDQLKNEDENWAFMVWENPSYETFESFDGPWGLIEYFERYRDVIEDEARFPTAFALYREKRDWNNWGAYREELKARKRERERRYRARKRANETSDQRERRLAREARNRKFQPGYKRKKERQKAKRANMTPEQREEYRRKARDRAKKSRDKNKK